MATRSLRFIFILAVFCLAAVTQATCYWGDGSVADTKAYQQCPGLAWCCKKTDMCASNGLCIDLNNKPDGSLTALTDGKSYNFTGLYQTAPCTNRDFSGCRTECSNAQSNEIAYIWRCNSANSRFCCTGSYSLFQQGSCCVKQENIFSLAVASRIQWNANPAVISASVSGSQSSPAVVNVASSNPASSAASSPAASSQAASSASSVSNSSGGSASSSSSSPSGSSGSSSGSLSQTSSGSLPASSTSSGIGASTSAPLREANSTTNGDSASDNGDGGLAAGSKAGIGVGVGVGVLILLVAAFFIRRAKQKRSAVGQYAQALQHELPADHNYPPKPIEKFGNSYYAGPGYAHEVVLPTSELHGGYRRPTNELP